MILEVNSETDFVAKNEGFQALLNELADHLLAAKPATLEEAHASKMENGSTVEEHITSAIAKIGEKITLRRFSVIKKEDNAAFGSYLHMGGRIGVLAVLNGTTDEELARDIAMHVAAVNPKYISRDQVSEEEANREREVLTQQALLQEGKPENIVAKMVEGRLNKFFEEICLLDQAFVKNPDEKKVKQVVAAKNATVQTYVRYEVGEGIEKKTSRQLC
ncbi:hypothetical protein BsIDN1_30190 [Bacillus safensis]|uniref:Elongation factor Ts n=1 Tax=Bacillus safensis TaxID=561879 RepID=A0A5S9M926_BACIA|nr:hypothetical protein BsIDN1_30190 [Bacillus safensis]